MREIRILFSFKFIFNLPNQLLGRITYRSVKTNKGLEICTVIKNLQFQVDGISKASAINSIMAMLGLAFKFVISEIKAFDTPEIRANVDFFIFFSLRTLSTFLQNRYLYR